MILSFKRDVDKKNPVDTLNDKWPKGGKKHTHSRQMELNRVRDQKQSVMATDRVRSVRTVRVCLDVDIGTLELY
jgi:hypothetical protein